MIEAPNGIITFDFVKGYERRGLYALDEVHPFLGDESKEYDGVQIKMDSARYRLFRKGCACVTCGVEGRFYAMERSARFVKSTGTYKPTTNDWHFNLYAVVETEEGPETVLMTKDHIVPKSKNGPDHDDNYQPMCAPCNTRKGNRSPAETDNEYAQARRMAQDEIRRREQSGRDKAKADRKRLEALGAIYPHDASRLRKFENRLKCARDLERKARRMTAPEERNLLLAQAKAIRVKAEMKAGLGVK